MAKQAAVTVADPAGLVRALEASGRFRRDTRLGGLFHLGEISFREDSPTNSLHVTIAGNRLRAHVDEVCPLDCQTGGSRQYSLTRVIAHNLAGMVEDVGRRIRGLNGRQRCTLECEAVWFDDEAEAETRMELVDLLGDAGVPAPEEEPPSSARPLQVPFGLVDEAIHLLDSEADPWSIQLEARVAGPLDEGRLREAVASALSRHRMARARAHSAGGWRAQSHWEIPDRPDVDPVRVVECPDDESLTAARAELQSASVALEQSPPLRVWLVRHPHGDVVMLNVNHAAMDGLGALRVLESVARAYAGDHDPAASVEEAEAHRLPARLDRIDAVSRIRRYLALIDKLGDLVVPPARVAADGGGDEAGYGFHHVTLPPARTRALAELDHPGTLNDLLLAALHLAIADWNDEHGEPCDHVGVLVPANLRPAEWRRDMVGNFTLPARVATTTDDRKTPESTLAAVTACTRRKKESGMGTALLELLCRTRSVPRWAKRAMVGLLPLTGNRLVDTAMLSNLGRFDDAPSFGAEAGELTELWFSPPTRMPLGLSVGAATVSGRLHLAFRYRRCLFGPEAARRFVDGYIARLESFAGAFA
jgi:NRPS condensation-like uncharacterized protein